MEGDGVKTSLLYAIEVSPLMLEPTESGQSSIQIAISAIEEFLRRTMTENPNTCLGVLFYGVEGHPQGIYTYLPVEQQDSKAVKSIQRLASDSDYLTAQLRPASCKLSDVFFTCGQEFEKDTQKSLRKLVIVTNNDDPTGGDEKLTQAAATRCEDLVEKGVLIDPVFVTSDKKPFNIQKFWDDLKYSQFSTTLKTTVSPATSIKAGIFAGSATKRSLFKCRLKIKDTVVSNVKGFNLYAPRKPPLPRQVHVDLETLRLAHSKTTHIVEETGAEIPKEDIKRAFKFGGEFLPPISEEHLKELRDFGEPEINVIGTINKDLFKFIGHTKHSVFLYPYEGDLNGSIRGFTALWQSLLKKNKYGVAKAILRSNSTPYMCMLVPTQAKYFTDEKTLQRTPSGLHLVFLPFLDDLRRCPNPPVNTEYELSNENARTAFKEIISKLTMKAGYNPMRYHNPSLMWFDEVIEATALSLEMPGGFSDDTLPKYNSIQKRVSHEINQFLAAYEDEPAGKRARPDTNE